MFLTISATYREMSATYHEMISTCNIICERVVPNIAALIMFFLTGVNFDDPVERICLLLKYKVNFDDPDVMSSVVNSCNKVANMYVLIKNNFKLLRTLTLIFDPPTMQYYICRLCSDETTTEKLEV